MDRGAWWAIVMGLQGVGHGLVTEEQGSLKQSFPWIRYHGSYHHHFPAVTQQRPPLQSLFGHKKVSLHLWLNDTCNVCVGFCGCVRTDPFVVLTCIKGCVYF